MNDQAGHNLADFLWYVDDAIIPIRKAGWRGTLVIDSLAMAQSPHPILKYGQVRIIIKTNKIIKFIENVLFESN